MIGIHTPEFDFEKQRKQVIRVANRHGSKYPIMMDNSYTYWNSLGNRYWPSFYLVDKSGRIVKTIYGEMHNETGRGRAFENEILKLLD